MGFFIGLITGGFLMWLMLGITIKGYIKDIRKLEDKISVVEEKLRSYIEDH